MKRILLAFALALALGTGAGVMTFHAAPAFEDSCTGSGY
jgi:hypothetical protein